MIRILVADEHAVVREGLKQIVTANQDMVVAGEAKSGQEVLDEISKGHYDVVLLDISIPGRSWLDVLKELRRILKTEGTIEIWVPDLRKLVQAYLKPSLVACDGWYKFNPEKDATKWFNGRLFTYGPGEENWHRAAFDEEYLRRCLKQAGFRHTVRLNRPRGYDHKWINLGIAAVK